MRLALIVLLVASALSSCGGARVLGRHRTQGWTTATTDHVVLTTDLDEQTALETAWALEDLHRALTHVFLDCAPLATEERTEVVMLSDIRDYVDVGPPQTQGFFTLGRTGVGTIPARVVIPASLDGRNVNIAAVFVHELTHRLVYACFPDAPTWLNEGIATYFETLRVRDDAVLVGNAPYRFEPGEARALVRPEGGRVHQLDPSLLLPASALVSLSARDFYAHDLDPVIRTANYAAAWALVHLLLVGGDGDLRARFTRYLDLLRSSRLDATRAFTEAFRGRDLDRELSAYVGIGERRRRRIPYTPAAFARPSAYPLAPSEVDLLWAELFIPGGGRERRARAYLERARRDPFTRVRALLLLAGMETDLLVRRQLVEEARTEDPADRDVLRARGWLEVERNVRDAASDALFAEISSLRRPSTMDLVLSARLAAQGRDASVALEAAHAAVTRDPTSWSARYALALAYMAASQWDAARAELHAVLTATTQHEPEVTRQAFALLTRMASARSAPEPSAPELAPGTFNPQIVVRAINTRRTAIQACYERALQTTPTLAGRVTVQLTVETSGELTGVQVVAGPADLEAVGACVCRVLDELTFDPGPTDASVTYTFPFVFEPQS